VYGLLRETRTLSCSLQADKAKLDNETYVVTVVLLL
jgi:hypothetical protein